MRFIPAPVATASEPENGGHEQEGSGVRAEGEDREKRDAARVPAVVPFPVERRPKRRKTSEVVTRMEMMMRMMMIHVWSDSQVSAYLYVDEWRWIGKLTRGFVVGDGIGEDFCEVEEDSTSLVEHLDTRFDLKVFADGDIERVQRWFALPEEIRDVEHVGG